MNRQQPAGWRRSAAPVVMCLLALAALACDDSGPVEDVFLLEGRLEFQGEQLHSLTTMDEGIARFDVVALRPLLIDVTLGSTITVGLGVGQPQGDECRTSFRTSARVGSVFSIGFEQDREYCVLVFDPGTLPEDALIDYTISVSPG